MNFALYYASDAYSTDRKIMGRQSAGKALMKGVARRWPEGELHAFGTRRAAGETMARQLRVDGFTGTVRWRQAPGDPVLDRLGAVYYPAPVTAALAHARNARGPAAYSLFGVTHTLSSEGGMDQVAAMAFAPFQPWDALICTSTAALSVVNRLQAELRDWYADQMGVTRFEPALLPVIPLGIDVPSFTPDPARIAEARRALELQPGDVAFLFAGRMSFHAKANPAVFYQALEVAASRVQGRLVCIEAGVYPNPATADAFAEARARLAPSARFIQVDGEVETAYRQAWQAADVFVSLSDNIQETFGLTPIEAMAAGLPVLVSDWDGYKDTVRDGIDGYRIPVTLPPNGTGADLAMRHAHGQDTYDYFIGRVSMATVIDPVVLTERVVALAANPELRLSLGEAGRIRAEAEFDWPVILDRYVELAGELARVRAAAGTRKPVPLRSRPDPFCLFADYPTRVLAETSILRAQGDAAAVQAMLTLGVAKYVLDDATLPADRIVAVHEALIRQDHTLETLLATQSGPRAVTVRAAMWLAKLGLVTLNDRGVRD